MLQCRKRGETTTFNVSIDKNYRAFCIFYIKSYNDVEANTACSFLKNVENIVVCQIQISFFIKCDKIPHFLMSHLRPRTSPSEAISITIQFLHVYMTENNPN